MKILVTAFGPFAGRSENASSLALAGLKEAFPEIRTRILPVDSVIAPARLTQALKTLRPDVIILLGEAAGSKKIRLETTAWNELDFRIPDIAGRQPSGCEIVPGGTPFALSTLPLDGFLHRLDASGHLATLSHDPGRYLCNQVFYLALDFLRSREIPSRAGFIHLPLAQDYATPRTVAALSELIRAL